MTHLFIDPRVHYVGMTALRTLNFERLPQDEIYVLQDRWTPVSVLVPYALYQEMQAALPAAPPAPPQAPSGRMTKTDDDENPLAR